MTLLQEVSNKWPVLIPFSRADVISDRGANAARLL